MGIIADLTPKYYRLIRFSVQRDGSDIVATGDLQILNKKGHVLCTHYPSTALTPQEKQALGAFAARELSLFEDATGLEEVE